jgi:hypothetical protein
MGGKNASANAEAKSEQGKPVLLLLPEFYPHI